MLVKKKKFPLPPLGHRSQKRIFRPQGTSRGHLAWPYLRTGQTSTSQDDVCLSMFQENKPEIFQHLSLLPCSGNESLQCEKVWGRTQTTGVIHTGTQVALPLSLPHLSAWHHYSPRCRGQSLHILLFFLIPLSNSSTILTAPTPNCISNLTPCTKTTLTTMGQKPLHTSSLVSLPLLLSLHSIIQKS